MLLALRTIIFSWSSLIPLSHRRIIARSSLSLSDKFGMNGMSVPATINSCTVRFCGVLQKAFVSSASKRKPAKGILRNLCMCASPLISSSTPLIIHNQSSLVVASQLSPSDTPQRSDEWFALRRDKLTTSTFSAALGFWKGKRRIELWHEKVFESEEQILDSSKKRAMEWGVLNEAAAIDRYKNITGHDVSSLGFAVHSKEHFHWLGASPDGLLGCFQGGGVLEVKCPYNKGKPETGLPWSKMPFYYMPQVQGQMEIMDRDWVDLYCWTPKGSTIFRVSRNQGYWDLIHGILRDFWWENVVPARKYVLLGRAEEALSYKPASTHKLTGLVIAKSIKLATEAKLLCRELAGHVEFYK